MAVPKISTIAQEKSAGVIIAPQNVNSSSYLYELQIY